MKYTLISKLRNVSYYEFTHENDYSITRYDFIQILCIKWIIELMYEVELLTAKKVKNR